jgi:hypothetical protein
MLNQMPSKPFAVDLSRCLPLDIRYQGIDQRTPERLDIDNSVEHDCAEELRRFAGTRDGPVTQVGGKQPSRGKLATDFGLDALEVGHLLAAPGEGFGVQIGIPNLAQCLHYRSRHAGQAGNGVELAEAPFSKRRPDQRGQHFGWRHLDEAAAQPGGKLGQHQDFEADRVGARRRGTLHSIGHKA